MQKIERYGVIALLFLLVTIVAVTFWNEDSTEPSAESLARAGTQTQPAPAGGPGTLPARTPSADPAAEGRGRVRPTSLPAAGQTRIDPRLPLARDGQDRAQPAGRTASEPAALRFQETAAGPEATPAPAAARPSPREREAAAERVRTASRGHPPAATPADGERVAPAREGRAPARTTAAAPREVVVGPGDSLARIAQRHLGAEELWQAIASLNGITDPRRLQVGQRLRLPAAEAAVAVAAPTAASVAASTPAPSVAAPPTGATGGPSRAYRVQAGDVLSVIAQRECGSVRAVPTIVALNPGLDPDRLLVGQRIRLPVVEGARASDRQIAASTRDPGSSPGAAPRNVVH